MAGRQELIHGAGAWLLIPMLLASLTATASCQRIGSVGADSGNAVAIVSPSPGGTVDVGADSAVDVIAEHEAGIVRLELWVDGELVDSAPSPSGEPVTQMQASLFWAPDAPHSYALTVRAYDWQDAVLGTSTEVVTASSTLQQAAASGGDDSSEPALASAAGINFFRTETKRADPGETVALEWSVSGAKSAEIIEHPADGKNESPVHVKPSGRILVEMPADAGVDVSYTLRVPLEGGTALSETLTIGGNCVQEWFFEDHPPGCAENAALLTPAIEQHFENGVMLQLSNDETVYVLYDDNPNRTWETIDRAESRTGSGAGSDEKAPAGFFIPEGSLGSVWRDSPEIRSRLGWALDRQIEYTTEIQATSGDDSTVTFMLSVDGGVFRFELGGSGWSLMQ